MDISKVNIDGIPIMETTKQKHLGLTLSSEYESTFDISTSKII